MQGSGEMPGGVSPFCFFEPPHGYRNWPEPGACEPEEQTAGGKASGGISCNEVDGDGADDCPEKQSAIDGDSRVVGVPKAAAEPGSERNAGNNGEGSAGQLCAEEFVWIFFKRHGRSPLKCRDRLRIIAVQPLLKKQLLTF